MLSDTMRITRTIYIPSNNPLRLDSVLWIPPVTVRLSSVLVPIHSTQIAPLHISALPQAPSYCFKYGALSGMDWYKHRG